MDDPDSTACTTPGLQIEVPGGRKVPGRFPPHDVKAGRVSVQLDIRLDLLQVTISDNGIGFDMDAVLRDPEKWDHFGIRGILERARLVGGEATIDSKKGRGTRIVLRIPLADKETIRHGKN